MKNFITKCFAWTWLILAGILLLPLVITAFIAVILVIITSWSFDIVAVRANDTAGQRRTDPTGTGSLAKIS